MGPEHHTEFQKKRYQSQENFWTERRTDSNSWDLSRGPKKAGNQQSVSKKNNQTGANHIAVKQNFVIFHKIYWRNPTNLIAFNPYQANDTFIQKPIQRFAL